MTDKTNEDLQWLPSARRYRLALSCCMPMVFAASGLATTIVSPTIIDMKAFFGCDYEEYSQALMPRSFGILIGSYIGGIAVDRYRKYFSLFVCCNILIFGIVTAIMPLYPSLILLGCLNAIQGICQGCINVSCNSYNLSIWGEKAPLPMYALHVAFNSGQAVGPLISKPFITHLNNTNNWNSTMSPNITTPSRLFYVPYVILGSYCTLMSMVFLLLYFIPTPDTICHQNRQHKTFKEIFSPAACAGGNALFATIWLIGLFITYFIHVSRMNTITIFLYPLAVESKLHLSNNEATYLQTVFYICASAGRLFTGLLSICFSIKILLMILITLAAGAYCGLTFLGLTAQYMLWIWLCSTVLFASPVYPTVMAWSDRYIEVTGLVVAVIDTGIAAGVFTSSWISGVIYQRLGGQALLYFCFGCAASVFLFVILMQIIGMLHGDRYDRLSKENKKVNDESLDENSPLIN